MNNPGRIIDINFSRKEKCFVPANTEAVAVTMDSLIGQFATISTAIFGQMATICDTIVSNPLLLFTTGFLFLGGCVGIFGRLLSRN